MICIYIRDPVCIYSDIFIDVATNTHIAYRDIHGTLLIVRSLPSSVYYREPLLLPRKWDGVLVVACLRSRCRFSRVLPG